MSKMTKLKQKLQLSQSIEPKDADHPTDEEVFGYIQQAGRIESLGEFVDLIKLSQLDLQFSSNSTGFWVAGHPIEIYHFPNTDSLKVIAWEVIAEKLDGRIHQVYCLEEGFNHHYLKLMQDIRISAKDKTIPKEALYAQCGLYINIVQEGGELYYVISETCKLEELTERGVEIYGISKVLGHMFDEPQTKIDDFVISMSFDTNINELGI
ncbi:hypothetical protein [Sporosarcina sp. JAI121]|uniref:hypothetical protein n=1 Tax=Sporosarcina sp. JAI121 TaxID=2723064 RepID=UPI0015CB73E4|nr:hypothetical protein [Sporosarcina sp. JAI121]NYF23565.1 hypothetical protein [Sporosarcina sp. JAI121]